LAFLRYLTSIVNDCEVWTTLGPQSTWVSNMAHESHDADAELTAQPINLLCSEPYYSMNFIWQKLSESNRILNFDL
jgi:hypothetical protein